MNWTAPVVGQRDIHELTASAGRIDGVRRSQLGRGDWLVVRTKNSVYTILVLGGGRFSVSGGWFDGAGEAPAEVTISGCTWGGRAILTEVVAATGMFLEFGNNVTTTRIRNIRLVRGNAAETVN